LWKAMGILSYVAYKPTIIQAQVQVA